jgi:hypothetical protein
MKRSSRLLATTTPSIAAANRLRKQKNRLEVLVLPHVAQAEDEDQQPDKAHHDAHERVQGVEEPAEAHGAVAEVEPGEVAERCAPAPRGRAQREAREDERPASRRSPRPRRSAPAPGVTAPRPPRGAAARESARGWETIRLAWRDQPFRRVASWQADVPLVPVDRDHEGEADRGLGGRDGDREERRR